MSSPTTESETAQQQQTRLSKKNFRDQQATEGLFTKIFGSMKRYNKRPFPWCLLPDGAWFCIGLVCLIFISIPCMVLIMASTITGEIVRAAMRTQVGGKLYAQARDYIHGISQKVANQIMIDPRNHSYLPWTLFESTFIPFVAYLAYQRHLVAGFEFSTMLLYHFIRLGPRFRLFAHHQVLIHKEGHNHQGLFKGPWTAINRLNSMWCGYFYGSMTGSYSAGHNKIHHRWHNDADDVHSNIDLDRTYFSNYVLWLPRFLLYWTGVSCLALFLKRAEYRLAAEILFGQIWWALGMALVIKKAGLFFCIAYFVYPMGESIAFLGSMGYLWHAFVQPEDPTNQYINSITILNGQDNIWNEDYHVVHHHAPFVHWSEAESFYKQTEEKYRECTATIFRDCEQGQLIAWIFGNKWDTLAEHFVDLNGKLDHEGKKALILRRLKFHRLGGFHDDESGSSSSSGWGTGEIRDWDTTSKEEQDAKNGVAKKSTTTATTSEFPSTNTTSSIPEEMPVTEYVDNLVDVILKGTGEPVDSHFAPRYDGQTLDAALEKHAYFLALQAKFKEGDRILDVGCSDVGRTTRGMARFLTSASKIVGVNSSECEVARCRRYDAWAKLAAGQVTYVPALKELPEATFNGAFSVETTARNHRDVCDKAKFFAEVHRTLKPGASFVGYEWVLTAKFDSKNDEHNKVRQRVENFAALGAPLQTSDKLIDALKAAGFDVTESFDVAQQYESAAAKTVPWYSALEGDFSSYVSFKNTPAGRIVIRGLVGLFEALNCAPKGSSEAIGRQEEKDAALIQAGKLGIISPCFFFHAVKKN